MIRILPILALVLLAVLARHFAARVSARRLAAQSQPLTDPAITRLADRMARAMDLPEIAVHVYDADQVNGMAAADGRIYLTRGFIAKKMQGDVSAEELASVIAHEMGHVALGHMRRRMVDFTGQKAAFVVLTAVLGRFIPFVGPWIAGTLSNALMARLSRRDEFEADAYATALLLKSGIGTAPQKSLFRKLDTLAKTGTAGLPVWLLSHPPAADRIAAIEANEARWLA